MSRWLTSCLYACKAAQYGASLTSSKAEQGADGDATAVLTTAELEQCYSRATAVLQQSYGSATAELAKQSRN